MSFKTRLCNLPLNQTRFLNRPVLLSVVWFTITKHLLWLFSKIWYTLLFYSVAFYLLWYSVDGGSLFFLILYIVYGFLSDKWFCINRIIVPGLILIVLGSQEFTFTFKVIWAQYRCSHPSHCFPLRIIELTPSSGLPLGLHSSGHVDNTSAPWGGISSITKGISENECSHNVGYFFTILNQGKAVPVEKTNWLSWLQIAWLKSLFGLKVESPAIPDADQFLNDRDVIQLTLCSVWLNSCINKRALH